MLHHQALICEDGVRSSPACIPKVAVDVVQRHVLNEVIDLVVSYVIEEVVAVQCVRTHAIIQCEEVFTLRTLHGLSLRLVHPRDHNGVVVHLDLQSLEDWATKEEGSRAWDDEYLDPALHTADPDRQMDAPISYRGVVAAKDEGLVSPAKNKTSERLRPLLQSATITSIMISCPPSTELAPPSWIPTMRPLR